MHQNRSADIESCTGQSVYRIGFWASIFTALSAIAALGIAVTTAPARSGPFCLTDVCVTYPYTDVATFVPNDYVWMYPAFLMGPVFVVLVACVHHLAGANKKLFSQIALSFAVISAAVLASNYFIQLTVVQPSLLMGETEGLTLLSQYNPHGLFIALEDVGYLATGIAFLFAGAAFYGHDRLERVIKIVLMVCSALTAGSLILLAMLYGSDLEYRYEVVAILIVWPALFVCGILASLYFKRAGR
jgi:hypothetical protein